MDVLSKRQSLYKNFISSRGTLELPSVIKILLSASQYLKWVFNPILLTLPQVRLTCSLSLLLSPKVFSNKYVLIAMCLKNW